MADVIYVCDSTGAATFAYPSIGLVQTTDCRNGTGRWVNATSYIDARIASYLAANPPSTPTAAVSFWEKEIPAEQVGPLLAAMFLCFAAAWLSRLIADEVRGK